MNNSEKIINEEFFKNGITTKLIEEINNFVVTTIEDNPRDRYWSDSAREVLGLLILSNLFDGNKISVLNLLKVIQFDSRVKKIILINIDNIRNNIILKPFTSNLEIINTEKPFQCVVEIIEEGLKNLVKDKYNELEIMIPFLDIDNIKTSDDDTEDYDWVCGIKIEKNYYIDNTTEQTILFDYSEGKHLDLDGSAKIEKISKNEIILKVDDYIILNNVLEREDEEKGKKDVILKLNQFTSGISAKFMPVMVYFKIKVLYIRKQKKIHRMIK